jgi:hypothetical protein
MAKKGQASIVELPLAVLLIGIVFVVISIVCFIGMKYGQALPDGSMAQNITIYDMQVEMSNNTSIAGIVLTMSLVGIACSVFMGMFFLMRGKSEAGA